ncbi:uncharacterized protein LOC131939963 [Physella acuta]|uniref:uncharacterized protein LOC131939963 n=1 Tax=Physella acuta TaxID=109671 RepID=UPI0027DE59DD|nr:uncharacterized protein LOC131939963 [Physella acuta]
MSLGVRCSHRRLKLVGQVVVVVVCLNILLLVLSFNWKILNSSPYMNYLPFDGSVVNHAVPKETALPKFENENELRIPTASSHLQRHPVLHPVNKDYVQKTACSYRTTAYLFDKPIVLDEPPFMVYTKLMACYEEGNIADFGGKFAMFINAIINPKQFENLQKGGENIEDVWNQDEKDEYFRLLPGFFRVPCTSKPVIEFEPPDHLVHWMEMLACYKTNETDLLRFPKVSSVTLAVQRYEYVNLYHTMTDFYNAFVLMLIFGVAPSKLNILFVDAHPVGTLDDVWSTLFGRYIRAGRLESPTLFTNLLWAQLGYFSPLNSHYLSTVPYLTEFRDFFLTKHNISTSHSIHCDRLNVVIIWRRDYVAHPRNKNGNVVRKFDNEEEILQQVRATLGPTANVHGHQLDALPMREQLSIIAGCDILIGMHGAGLSHILFLPPSSGVIELKPSYTDSALNHFGAFSRWRNLTYTNWDNSDTSNERDSFKTYIPRSVIDERVKRVYSQICKT